MFAPDDITQSGTHDLRIEVRDDDAGGTGVLESGFESFTLTVIPVNLNPICPTIAHISSHVNAGPVVHSFAISDPDSTDTLTTTITYTDGSPVDSSWFEFT